MKTEEQKYHHNTVIAVVFDNAPLFYCKDSHKLEQKMPESPSMFTYGRLNKVNVVVNTVYSVPCKLNSKNWHNILILWTCSAHFSWSQIVIRDVSSTFQLPTIYACSIALYPLN